MKSRGCILWLVLLLVSGRPPVALAQQHDHPPSEASTDTLPVPRPSTSDSPAPVVMDPDSLPVNVGRIQRRLSRPAAIQPERARQVFRVEIFGRSPTIDEILGPDWRRGPVPLGGMTHQEFLSIVTPKDVQGYAAYDNRQALTVAATSFALQWALRQAVKKLDDARTERQQEAARKEVDAALAALRKARRDAGLPD